MGLMLAVLPVSVQSEGALRFCVLVPHFKDEYWLSVSFGLEQEANRQDVTLSFHGAGGYRARSTQIDQVEGCIAQGVDAILIGAVSSNHPELTAAIAQASRAVPVYSLVNELHVEELTGRIGVDWQDMGYVIGEDLSARHPTGSEPKTAILLNGPSEAGWTGPLEAGLRDGLSDSSLTILDVFQADTGLRAQLELVENALLRHADVDYIIGNAPAIEAAFGLFASNTPDDPPLLVSTYVNHTVLRGLRNGNVVAAPFDDPMLQGKLALQLAVTAADSGLVNSGALVGPEIDLLTPDSGKLTDVRLSPADYFPPTE